jgi:hypothetical protein
MGHKLGDDHAAARQELFDCNVLFHVFPLAYCATGDATTAAVELYND